MHFKLDLIAIMPNITPGGEWSGPLPAGHLWEHGYIDSIGWPELIPLVIDARQQDPVHKALLVALADDSSR
jgi:hypothetical protein